MGRHFAGLLPRTRRCKHPRGARERSTTGRLFRDEAPRSCGPAELRRSAEALARDMEWIAERVARDPVARTQALCLASSASQWHGMQD